MMYDLDSKVSLYSCSFNMKKHEDTGYNLDFTKTSDCHGNSKLVVAKLIVAKVFKYLPNTS